MIDFRQLKEMPFRKLVKPLENTFALAFKNEGLPQGMSCLRRDSATYTGGDSPGKDQP